MNPHISSMLWVVQWKSCSLWNPEFNFPPQFAKWNHFDVLNKSFIRRRMSSHPNFKCSNFTKPSLLIIAQNQRWCIIVFWQKEEPVIRYSLQHVSLPLVSCPPPGRSTQGGRLRSHTRTGGFGWTAATPWRNLSTPSETEKKNHQD